MEKEIKTVPFVHLHNHTDFSTYDGFQSPLSLARRAKELDMKAIAITDHGKVGGFIKFYNACKGEKRPTDEDPEKLKEKLEKHNPKWERSIKPILGCEFYISQDLSIKKNTGGGRRYHLLVLAKNNDGLRNIYKLCSEAHRHTAYNFPRIDLNMLKEHKEGLIVTTACMAGEFQKLVLEGYKSEAFEMAEKYKEIFGDDFYLEVMFTDQKGTSVGDGQIEIIKAAMECSKKYDIKIIATNDCHYNKKEDYKHQQVKKTISMRRPMEEPDAPEYYLKSYDQMKKIFKGPGVEWLNNTVEIADKCDVSIEFGQVELPQFTIPEDPDFEKYKIGRFGRSNEQSYLRYLAFKGLKSKGLISKKEYVERLKSELETIMFTGFDRYFLIVSEYCEFARKEQIRIGCGRGSGVGSLVLYCLGVTGLDPIKYKLGMDRFLYCEAEYRVGIGDIYSTEENPKWEPGGRGGKQRERTEQEKRSFNKIREACQLKISNLNDDQKARVVEELKFLLMAPTVVDDIFELGKIRRIKKVAGDKNCVNSYILELLGITEEPADLRKDFFFSYVVDSAQSRISPPDIDIDFETREPILNHLCELYGKEKVALIGTCNTYKPKAAVQNAWKAVDPNKHNNVWEKRFSSETDQEAKEASKLMPNLPGVTLTQFIGEDPKYKAPNNRVQESINRMKEIKEEYPEVIESALGLEGNIRAYGTHAAGVVISSRDITDDVPLHFAKMQKEGDGEIISSSSETVDLLTTQYDMEEVEKLGLLKFDFLQLQNLRQISECLRLIEDRYGEVSFDIDNLTTDDHNVFKTIDEMKLEGLFQISGEAFTGKDWPRKNKETGETLRDEKGNVKYFHAKGVMEIIGCHSFEDIVASNALGRPGPLALDMPKKYAIGKNNPDMIEYPHESLTDILESTYGELCISGDEEIYDFKRNKIVKLREVSEKTVSVQTIDKNGDYEILKNRRVVNKGRKECIRLHFKDGTTLDCTPDHELFTENGKIKAIESLGKYVCFSKKTIINEEKKYNPNISRMVGMLIGDGDISKYRVVLCCKDDKYSSFFKNIVKSNFNVKFSEYFNCRCNYVSVNSGISNHESEVLKFNRKIGIQGSIARNKKVPNYLFNASIEEKIQFILGYFDTDGHIGLNKNNSIEMSFKTCSIDLSVSFKRLLNTLGYSSTIYKDKSGYLQIDIDDKFLFIEEVLLKSDSLKIDSIKSIYNKTKNTNKKHNKNTYDRDSIKNYLYEYYNLKSGREAESLTGITRHHFYKNNKRIKESSLKGKQFESFYFFRNCNNVLVERIEPIGSVDVYDILNCGENKIFCLFNGAIVSNCYQEQLIQMAQVLAGFTFSEADGLRKACAKKKIDLLDKLEPKFKSGCLKNGIPNNTIENMWNIAVEFGAYAFNLSHSAAYGYITYQTAYLKTYYPAEFLSALLTSAASASDEKLEIVTGKLMKEFPKMEILKPEINKSHATYYPVGKNKKNIKIIAPFFSIKGVGRKASDAIINERSKLQNEVFVNMNSFLQSVNSSGKTVVTNSVGNILIDCGVFDEFGSRNSVREEMIRYSSIKKASSRGKKTYTDVSIVSTKLF